MSPPNFNKSEFNISLKRIHWLQSFEDKDELDLCAHGQVQVSIGNEIIVDNSDDPHDWWSLTAMALHLLRTLDLDHTAESRVGDCLVPGEDHHIDHHENNPIVHIETVYPMVDGRNWWVVHESSNVILTTESSNKTIVSIETYKNEVLKFVDKVKGFYESSKPKILPENQYDKEGYLKMWREWDSRRNKWT